MRSRIRRLSFDVGPPGRDYQFRALTRVCGIEVGVDLEEVEPEERPRTLRLCQSEHFFLYRVGSIVDWCRKLELELEDFYVQFVFSIGFGANVRMGQAIVGRRGRAVLLIQSFIHREQQLGVFTIYFEPDNPEKILCEDIVPHELMHILDVRQGRSPSVYPYLPPGQGKWLDLFRHLWIDGYLEQHGLPYLPREKRIRDLAEAIGTEKAETLASAWWGKPMTMRDAVRLGLDAGLALEQDSPMAIWWKNIKHS